MFPQDTQAQPQEQSGSPQLLQRQPLKIQQGSAVVTNPYHLDTVSDGSIDRFTDTASRNPEPGDTKHANNEDADSHSQERDTLPDRESVTINQEDSDYPEGGYGWLVLASTFVSAFWCLGVPFCWGVFQEYFLRMETFPGADARRLSWVGSLSCACIFIAAPAIVVMTSRIGTRAALTVGLFSVMLGFVAGSFATEYWHLYLTIGVLYGVGGGTVYFSAITVLAQYFLKRRAVVVGIAISGSGIGATVMAPLLRWMLVQIGFRWSMRIMGGAMFVCLGCASLFVRPYQRPTVVYLSSPPHVLSPSHQSIVQDLTSATPELSTIANEAATHPPDPSPPSLDFRLFKSLSFSLIFLATNLFALVYLVPLLLAPSFATSIGLSAAEGATMISIASAVGIVARILIGYLADRYGVLNATLICCTITGFACLTLWLKAASFATLAIFMVFYGCFAGSTIMLFPVAATKAVNVLSTATALDNSDANDPSSNVGPAPARIGNADGISSALGFIFFAHTIGYLFGTPLAQYLIESQGGRYTGAIVFVGVSNLVCAVIVIAARINASKSFWTRI